MVARVVARSPLAGLTRNSVVYHLLAAAANEDAELYLQLARLRTLFSIDTATGSDLDDRAAEIQPAVIRRRTALYASGLATFSRPGIVGAVLIPAGTIIAGADTRGRIKFRTTAPATILVGNTFVAGVPITALEAGARSNVSANTIVQFVTRIVGVTGVTNPSLLSTGQDREADSEFRARLKAYTQGLSRGTPTALRSAALQVLLTTGQRVLFAQVFEPSIPNGTVRLYIEDGTGAIETFSSAFIGTPDVMLPAAVGGERDIFTTQRPIRDDTSFVFRVNALDQVRDVDYTLNASTGQITLSAASFPTGLSPGDIAEAEYRFYTGLIQQTQRVINGDPALPIQYPGVRAAGIAVYVLPPQTLLQSVQANLSVSSGFDVTAVTAKVRDAIQGYINSIDIGEDVIVAELIQRIMDVNGMFDVNLQDLTGSAPPVNQVVTSMQVARINSVNIVLT
jgi:uncharacterized phage protein gp47/JayE